ncbi:MAG: box helicase domain protein [Cytophagaceae bacterium]|jgi:ATP-dependent RNA helicase RhlE|nr:box helicase domain protein [Cytophagaceae bacterium]
MTFKELNLSNALLNALDDLGYVHPTTIQEKGFSVMMSGKDVVGIAQTGTGKTLAYLLPCLRQLKFAKDGLPQILIVVPTRELVVQVAEEVKKLTTYMEVRVGGVYGGTKIDTQREMVNDGLDVLVATPGRLLDLALTGVLKLRNVKRLIIDEVDEMLNLGFRPQLTRVIDLLPVKRQNLMFSATITEEVEEFIKDYFDDPIKIEAAPTGTPLENITQVGYRVPNFNTKINLLHLFLKEDDAMKKVLVFASTKQLADLIFDKLEKDFAGQLGVIHSNKEQNHRFHSVNQFENGTYRILIATDIVARGLDISSVTHVINFDAPKVPENYIHRIGRTGRADKKGEARTFITEQDWENLERIEELMKFQVDMSPLPANLVISDVLMDDELPKVKMKNVLVKTPKREEAGPAFHEKLEKNKKVNNKIRRGEAHKLKYGKPKSARGQKKR